MRLRIDVPLGAPAGERAVDELVVGVPGVPAKAAAKGAPGARRATFGVTIRCQMESPIEISVG